MVSKSPFLFSLKRQIETADPVGDEFNQLTAAVQQGNQALGRWAVLSLSDVQFYGTGTLVPTIDPGDIGIANSSGLHYSVFGSTLFLNVHISPFTIAGAGTEIRMVLPFNLVCQKTASGPLFVINTGTGILGLWVAVVGTNYVSFIRYDFANWAVGTDNNSIVGQLLLEVA